MGWGGGGVEECWHLNPRKGREKEIMTERVDRDLLSLRTMTVMVMHHSCFFTHLSLMIEEGERDREREREGEASRQAERQTGRQTGRQGRGDRETEREIYTG